MLVEVCFDTTNFDPDRVAIVVMRAQLDGVFPWEQLVRTETSGTAAVRVTRC